MSRTKCPHCGLVNFSTAGACKRCKKDLAAAPDSASSYQPASHANKSSSKSKSDYPLVSWVITVVLLTANASLAYVVAQKSTTNPYETLGGTIGGMVAWPLVLLIVYAVSKKFREKYSLHTVINYGLGLNSIIQSFMVLR